MTVWITRTVGIVALACGLLCQSARAQGTRHITVQATVQTSTGQPLENVPLTLLEAAGRPVAKTDPEGRATLVGDVPQEAAVVTIHVFGGGDDRFGSTAQQLALAKRMKSVQKQFFFDEFSNVALVGNQPEYSVVIVAWPVIAVSGALVTDTGQAEPEVVSCDASGSFTIADAQGAFSLHGVKRGTAIRLFLHGPAFAITPMRFSSQLTNNDVSIGQIVLVPYATTSQFRARLTNVSPWITIQESKLVPGLTLISANGSILFTEASQFYEAGQQEIRLRTDPLSLPPGDYYVAPGVFARGRVQLALLRAREQGMNLAGTGIPKVTLVAGQAVDVDVDLLAAYNAIRDHIGFE